MPVGAAGPPRSQSQSQSPAYAGESCFGSLCGSLPPTPREMPTRSLEAHTLPERMGILLDRCRRQLSCSRQGARQAELNLLQAESELQRVRRTWCERKEKRYRNRGSSRPARPARPDELPGAGCPRFESEPMASGHSSVPASAVRGDLGGTGAGSGGAIVARCRRAPSRKASLSSVTTEMVPTLQAAATVAVTPELAAKLEFELGGGALPTHAQVGPSSQLPADTNGEEQTTPSPTQVLMREPSSLASTNSPPSPDGLEGVTAQIFSATLVQQDTTDDIMRRPTIHHLGVRTS